MADDAKTIGEFKKLLGVQKESTEELEKRIKLYEKQLELTDDILEREDLLINKQKEQINLQEKEYEIAIEFVAKKKEELDQTIALLEKGGTNQELAERALATATEEFEKARENYETKKQILKVTKKIVDQQEQDLANLEDGFSNLYNKIGIQDLRKSGGLLNDILFAGKPSVVWAKFKEVSKKMLNLQNISKNLNKQIIEGTKILALSQDVAIAGFNKATGAGGQYDEMITDIGKDNLSLGITTDDAAKAVQDLYSSFSDFTMLARSAQAEVTKFAATMEKLGVDTGSTAEVLQLMTKNFALSVDQAMLAQRSIAATAKELGISIATAMDEFRTAGPSLAAHGDKAIKTFKELMTVAKATGIAISRLVDIAQKFDTFEGAADVVGRLNAILGGNFLDSMSMISMTDPVERIKAMRGALEQANKSFDQMSYYERRAIASAMGLQDVNELALLMSGRLEKSAAAADANALSQEEMAKMAEQSRDMMKQLTDMVQAFGISMRPVIVLVKKLLNGIIALNDYTGGAFMPILAGVLTLFALWRKSVVANIMVEKIATEVKTKLGAATETLGKKTAISGKAAGKGAIGMLAFGAAIALIGAGIWLATTGIAQLAESLKGMTGPEFAMLAGILLLIAGGIVALGFAGIAAAPGLLIFAGAVALVGLGIFLITSGLSLLIKSFTSMFAVLAQNAEAMKIVAPMFMQLSVAVMMFAFSAPFAAIGLGLMAIAFGALAISLALIKTADLMAVSTMFQAIGNFSTETAKNVMAVASAIREIAKAMDEIPEQKAMALAVSMQNTEAALDAAASYRGNIEASRTAAITNVISSVANNSTTNSNGGAQVIQLEIGGKVLDKYVVNVMNNRLDPRKA